MSVNDRAVGTNDDRAELDAGMYRPSVSCSVAHQLRSADNLPIVAVSRDETVAGSTENLLLNSVASVSGLVRYFVLMSYY